MHRLMFIIFNLVRANYVLPPPRMHIENAYKLFSNIISFAVNVENDYIISLHY